MIETFDQRLFSDIILKKIGRRGSEHIQIKKLIIRDEIETRKSETETECSAYCYTATTHSTKHKLIKLCDKHFAHSDCLAKYQTTNIHHQHQCPHLFCQNKTQQIYQ